MNHHSFGLTIKATDGAARQGQIATAHGSVDTPAFMPVGTAATIKAMTPEAVAQTGAEMVLANAYHLLLRPGPERIEQLGGLHKFMNWPGPILTDSGGFQVMSLAKFRKLEEEGVTFRSHIDGNLHQLTPEISVEIQRKLDADITMVFDECTAYPASETEAAESMRLSMRWARRSKKAFVQRPGYALFGIVQGGTYKELRSESVAVLTGIGFDGYAIGGLAVGEGQEEMLRVLEATTPLLPRDHPRYLMGVGNPDDILGAVALGVDLFDCVIPTRSGRMGRAYTRDGLLNLRNACHADDPTPLDGDCACPACAGHSRAYIHHLFKANEILGCVLLTWHNLHFYQDLMRDIRNAIAAGRFNSFANSFLGRYQTKKQLGAHPTPS
jgi:queuine tRNA-ribosyltransferase